FDVQGCLLLHFQAESSPGCLLKSSRFDIYGISSCRQTREGITAGRVRNGWVLDVSVHIHGDHFGVRNRSVASVGNHPTERTREGLRPGQTTEKKTNQETVSHLNTPMRNLV